MKGRSRIPVAAPFHFLQERVTLERKGNTLQAIEKVRFPIVELIAAERKSPRGENWEKAEAAIGLAGFRAL